LSAEACRYELLKNRPRVNCPPRRLPRADRKRRTSRVQTGVRIEKGLLKVLKAVAEYEEVSLGALLERIVLSSFMGQ